MREFVEAGAELEHIRWARWQKWCHEVFKDGKFEEFMLRWERQIATSYAELSEEEKEKDREQVRPYLPLIQSLLLSERTRLEGLMPREELKEDADYYVGYNACLREVRQALFGNEIT